MNNISIIELASDFSKLIVEKKRKLPYHINLIDEIGANENAHSKIFIKIISFEENGKYPFFELFIEFLGDEFKKINIISPKFTFEKFRIDGLIRDEKGKYAIIIENKIHDAIDQEKQIERYFKILLEQGFSENEIYVLYLTLKGGSPSENSFALNKRNNHYKEINFKNDIITFLKEYILPFCRVKDELLINSIKQYIDHLDGILNQREIDLKMNKELTKELLEKLKITDESTKYEKLSKVYQTIKEIQDVSFSLNEYCESEIKRELFDWKYKIQQRFNGKEIVTNIEDKRNNKFFYVGIKLKYNNQEFSCSIGMNDYYSPPYYGVSVRGCKEVKNSVLENFFEEKLNSFNLHVSPRWYSYKTTELPTVFEEFEVFCDKVIELIN